MEKKKNKAIEIITLIVIVIGAVLLIRSYLPQNVNLQKNKDLSSFLRIKDAMLLYYTANNSYPAEDVIFDMVTLKRELSYYVKEGTEFDFSYISYKNKGQDFELKIRKDGYVFVITAKGIEVDSSY